MGSVTWSKLRFVEFDGTPNDKSTFFGVPGPWASDLIVAAIDGNDLLMKYGNEEHPIYSLPKAVGPGFVHLVKIC